MRRDPETASGAGTAPGAGPPAHPSEQPADQAEGGAVEELQAALERERQRAADNWDRYLRAEADLENLRKRSARLRDEAVERQRREVLARFLDVADNLELALGHGDSEPEALLPGVQGTWRELLRQLSQEGVEPMEAQDAPFDPDLHDAVGVVPVPGEGPERVVSVERTGYTVHGELLRAARVLVGRPAGAAGGPGGGTPGARSPSGDTAGGGADPGGGA